MRRWFLARFYRLGFGSWFDPPTQHVDKAPVEVDVLGDEVLNSYPESDAQLTSEVDP